jgi:hypothetical protein
MKQTRRRGPPVTMTPESSRSSLVAVSRRGDPVSGALVAPYRDLEELLVEPGIEVDHVNLYWRVQRFTPFADRRSS